MSEGLLRYLHSRRGLCAFSVPQRSTVMRTRPIFREWELEFTVHFMPDIVDEHSLDEAVEIAGKLIGLSDYRPKYGRFEVQRAN